MLLCLLNCPFTFGQANKDIVRFVSNWNIGTSFQFQVQRIDREWENDAPPAIDTTFYTATFTVIDSSEKGYTIQWAMGDIYNTTQFFEGYEELVEKHKFDEITYMTSLQGAFVGLEDEEGYRARIKHFFDDFAEALGKEEGLDELSIQKMKDLFGETASAPNIVETTAPEIVHLHSPMGVEYDIHKTYPYSVSGMSMIGSTIRMDGEVFVEEFDPANSCFTLVDQGAMNEEDVNTAVKEHIEKLGLKGKEVKKALKKLKLDVTYKSASVCDYQKGIPRRFTYEKETVSSDLNGSAMSIEYLFIRMLEE